MEAQGYDWVSCKEKLPELRKRVLVTDGNTVCIAWINDYKKGFEGWITIDDEYLEEIKAWQYLPIGHTIFFKKDFKL